MSRRTGISAPCKVAKRTINVSLIIQSSAWKWRGSKGGWWWVASQSQSLRQQHYVPLCRSSAKKRYIIRLHRARTADSLLTVQQATMVGTATAALHFPSQDKSIRLGMNSLKRFANRLATGYSRMIGCGGFCRGQNAAETATDRPRR